MSELDLPLNYLASRPAKSFALALLRAHIQAINPARSLDAGCGELRTRHMFPGEYVGITLNKDAYLAGLERPENKGFLSTVHIIDLREDFSFLGTFDLCVCTNMLMYIEDGVDVIRRLADRVKPGGCLIFTDGIEQLAAYEPVRSLFSSWDVFYWGRPAGLVSMKKTDTFFKHMKSEMEGSDALDGQSHFYVLATGRV